MTASHTAAPASSPTIRHDRPASTDAGAERADRITWSFIAEPSDKAAWKLIEKLGHSEAVEAVHHGRSTELMRIFDGDVPVEDADPPRARQEPALRAERALIRWRDRLGALDLEEELDRAEARGLRVLTPGDLQWPRELEDLGAATPHCLWVHGPGNLAALVSGRTAGIVGSRASTPYGEDTASSLAAALAHSGGTVVSGGAYGIDAAAHRGALAAQEGATIAVLAGGLDSLYPRGNTRLLETIRDRHLLVSEVPLGKAPTRWRFLCRNRLIAALSQIVVVVEASWRSGALSTAAYADGISRPVGAVPGPVTSAASAGCHRLIRDRGAVLLTEHSEVMDLFPGGPPSGDSRYAQQDELDVLDPADRRVLDAVPPRSSSPVAVIARDIGIQAQQAQAAVARLELLGLVQQCDGRVRRVRSKAGRG